MYAPALSLVLVLVGCQATLPKVVRVPVVQIVPVPAELSAGCEIYQATQQTVGEAVRAANLRFASLQECNARLEKIRALNAP